MHTYFSRKRNKNTSRAALPAKEAGFTIVEVLISLLIFSVAVVGVITAAAQGGLNVDDSKLTLTATYLADEGIELARAMRDTAVISASTTAIGWGNFTATFGATLCTVASPCDIDQTVASTPFPSAANVASCAAGGFCPLYYTPSGDYSDTASPGSSATPYSRQLVIAPVAASGGNEEQVVSKVQYHEGTLTKTVTETEDVYNWY